MSEVNPWEKHYTREKSVLHYPDENLVRMLKTFLKDKKNNKDMTAIDIGCGSGRHMKILKELNINYIFGLDNSSNALNICSRLYQFPIVQAENLSLPIKKNSIDIAISWGSLHYSAKNLLKPQLLEIHNILKKGGRLFGTLRSYRDTYIKRGSPAGNNTWVTDLKDIKNTVISFYEEDELQSALKLFKRFEYGIIERTILGDINKVISHWFFWAEK